MRIILALSLALALSACCGARSDEKVEDISQSSNSGSGGNYFDQTDSEPGKKFYSEEEYSSR